jgi:HAD superfamily phosphoserine phosphatase-like hydrolase
VLSLLWQLLGLPPQEQLIEMARGYFDKYGLVTIFFASIIEGALLAGWYVPGGLVIFLGVILSHTPEQAMLSVLATIIGFLIAYKINFFVGKYGWYKVLLKLGVKSSLEKAERDFNKHGWKTIYFSYWEPNLASLVSTAAGIARASFQKFYFHSIIATVFWAVFWGSMAYAFGEQILEYLGFVFFGVMIIWIIYLVTRKKENIILPHKEIIKLICFDLDETLIIHSSWKKLHTALGISEDDDRRMFKEYKDGSISYSEWNNKVLQYYLKHKDATRAGVTSILSNYTYREGTKEIINYLKNKGYEIVLISGSIDILVNIISKDLGIKWAKAANTFMFDEEDRLVSIHDNGDDVDAKVRHLESFCEMLNIKISECAAIGDGPNDLKLFKETGHGITFTGTRVEKEAWKIIDSFDDLKRIF